MGGHGGLNILPQKRWNVYNFENREKVRKDEEAAAKEEQLKREQSLKRDAEFRLQQLRRARGLDPEAGADKQADPAESKPESPEPKSAADSRHINLFDGIKIFDPVVAEKKRENDGDKRKKTKKEERVVGPEDEKYRLGYGLVGKGVKAPWYMMKPEVEVEEEERESRGKGAVKSGEKRKKTVEELREERLKREKAEKERERALLMQKGRNHRVSSGDRDRYYRRNMTWFTPKQKAAALLQDQTLPSSSFNFMTQEEREGHSRPRNLTYSHLNYLDLIRWLVGGIHEEESLDYPGRQV